MKYWYAVKILIDERPWRYVEVRATDAQKAKDKVFIHHGCEIENACQIGQVVKLTARRICEV